MTFLIIFYCVVIPCLIMFVLLFPQTSFLKPGHSYQCHGSMKTTWTSETCANKLSFVLLFNLIYVIQLCPYMFSLSLISTGFGLNFLLFYSTYISYFEIIASFDAYIRWNSSFQVFCWVL